MKTDYLTWYKNIFTEIYPFSGRWSLLSSSIPEMSSLLEQHVAQARKDIFPERMAMTNEWGHRFLIDQISHRNAVPPKNTILTQGASNGIYLACRALCSPGDHVLSESPGYEPFWVVPRLHHLDVTFLHRKAPHYRIEPEDVSAMTGPKTRLILITNLHNPSGALLSEADILDILEAARERNPDIKILVDEIYRDFIPGNHIPSSSLDASIITISSLTKVYGLGLLRCGWMIADESIIQKVRTWQTSVYGVGSRILEVYSTLVFDNLDEYRTRSSEKVNHNRYLTQQALTPLFDRGIIQGPVPRHGCVHFMKIAGVPDTGALTAYLAQEYKVHVVPGEFFNDSSAIRIGFGGESHHIETALSKFVDGMMAYNR
jgi:aspartate/methionine/tyrosine aminotransferase